MLLACAAAGAQTFQEGYFLSDYRLAYRNNPASANDGDFISIGQYAGDKRANVGASAFLYPVEGGLVTALHPTISATTFLDRLKADNYQTGSLDYNLVSYGFRRGQAYHTIEIGARGSYGATVPKEIFEIVKNGTSRSEYDLGNAGIQAKLYAEIAYGYSRRINELVSVGFRAKLLAGLNSVDYHISRFDLSVGEEKYTADIEGNLAMTNRYVNFVPDADGFLTPFKTTPKGRWKLPSGGGLALDLGVELYPAEGLTISASVLNLGGILWYYGNYGQSDGSFTFTGVTDLHYEDFNKEGFVSELKGIGDEFLHTLRLRQNSKKTRIDAVTPQAYLGAKYRLPFYSRLTVGAVGSYCGSGHTGYWDARGGFSVNPVDWFEISGSLGGSTYGMVYGIAASVRIQNFRLNVGRHNGFGGKIPYRSIFLQPNCIATTLGITYDL